MSVMICCFFKPFSKYIDKSIFICVCLCVAAHVYESYCYEGQWLFCQHSSGITELNIFTLEESRRLSGIEVSNC